MKINEAHLHVFIDCVVRYFDMVSDFKASVGSPYLISNVGEKLDEYTGIISISGSMKGSIFFTASKAMLAYLLRDLGSFISTEEHKLLDLVGEIGNTISGNARAEFGEQFILSVPLVMKGKSEQLAVSETYQIFVIPIVWKQQKANLIINLSA